MVLESAVGPDDVDLPRCVDLYRWQRDAGPDIAGRMSELDWGNSDGRSPAGASVIGGKRVDEEVDSAEAVDGDDHLSARLHHRLPADAVQLVGGGQRRAPRLSSVAGGAHQHQVAECVVIELRIAVPVERAAGGVVADCPVLVVELAAGVYHHGLTPAHPAIRGAANKEIHKG